MTIWLVVSVAFAWSVVADYARGPVPIPFSDTAYGPDGPWHAVTVAFGTPPQSVDLFPGATNGSIVFSAAKCTASADCQAYNGGVYNASLSSSGHATGQLAEEFDWVYPLNFGSEQSFWTDTMTLPTGSIPDVGMVLVTSFYVFYSSEVSIDVNLGQFWLGAPAASFSVPQRNGTVTVNSPSGYLWQNGITPSDSFGLHIGSPSLGIPGSLWLGGYDQSRVLGPVLSNAYAFNTGSAGAIWSVDILDISVFSFQNRTGLLSQGNSSLAESLNSVAIAPNSPFLALPPSVCAAMVQDLPVEFSPKLGVYLWDTGASNFSKTVESASYFSFKFRQSSLVVNVPFKLLNLTLEAPLVDKPTQYFPCYPTVNTPYALGKAFLQAAFLGTNWAPDALPGTWFLAQAPGPNTAAVPDVHAIANSDTTIASSDVRWEDTWDGFWTPIDTWFLANDSISATQSSFATPGNITAVVLGPVLFLAVVSLAIYAWTRKKKSRRSVAEHDHVPDGESALSASKNPGEVEDAMQNMPQEVPGIHKQPSLRYEMSAPVAELPASSPRIPASPRLPAFSFSSL